MNNSAYNHIASANLADEKQEDVKQDETPETENKNDDKLFEADEI